MMPMTLVMTTPHLGQAGRKAPLIHGQASRTVHLCHAADHARLPAQPPSQALTP
jgi:hypothetical protein